MEVRITGRHAHVAEKIKAYALEKLGPLSRYYDRTRHLEVVFDEDHLGWKIEAIAHLQRGAPLVATIRHKEATAAVDLAHDKLERLLTKEKDRRRARRRDGRGAPSASPPAAPSDDAGGGARSSEEE